MFITMAKYCEIVSVLRAQPAHLRPQFKEAAKAVGVDRRTLATGWKRGWLATLDPRRPTALPPLHTVCMESNDPGGWPALVAAVPSPPRAPAAAEDATRAPESARAHEVASAAPMGPTSAAVISAPTEDPIAEIARRQAELDHKEREALRAALVLSGNFRVFASTAAKLLYDALLSPTGRAKFVSFFTEHPEKADSFAANLGRLLADATKSDERVFSMRRLQEGLPTAVQEHRVTREPPPPPTEKTERLASLLRQLQGLGQAQSAAPSSYSGENVIDVEPEPVAATSVAPSAGEGPPP